MSNFLSGLYIVSTPIGNLEDITLRALNVLKNSDKILCEDTRRSLKLLNHYGIKKKLISYHKFNEKKELNKIIQHLNEGKILSLISDAGTPLLSDPGRLLVNECIEKGIKVSPIPGVSSITSSLSVSGFNDKFLFYGFLPKTENQLEKVLSSLSKNLFTQIFFLPSKKLNFYLKGFKKFFSGRQIMIAKEITKIHEAFIRAEIDDLKIFKSTVKGELTVVISEKKLDKKNSQNLSESDKINIGKMINKLTTKEITNLISQNSKVPKKEIYNYCLKLKNEK